MTIRAVGYFDNPSETLTANAQRLVEGAAFLRGAYDDANLMPRGGPLPAGTGYDGRTSLVGTSLRTSAGQFIVPGVVDGAQGAYVVVNDARVDKTVTTTQHASQHRRVALVMAVRDSVVGGRSPAPGDPNDDYADLKLVEGNLSATSPAPYPNVTGYEAFVVLGWVNVPPAGQALTWTPNPAAQAGSRTGITPADANDTTPGSYPNAFRFHATEGLQRWVGGSAGWAPVWSRQTDAQRLRLTGTSDASAGSTEHPFQIGPTTGENLVMDAGEIMARKGGAIAPLYLTSPRVAAGSHALHAASTPGDSLASKQYVIDLAGALGSWVAQDLHDSFSVTRSLRLTLRNVCFVTVRVSRASWGAGQYLGNVGAANAPGRVWHSQAFDNANKPIDVKVDVNGQVTLEDSGTGGLRWSDSWPTI